MIGRTHADSRITVSRKTMDEGEGRGEEERENWSSRFSYRQRVVKLKCTEGKV